ncbi:hypothetical protein [Lysinibacter cavernae]|uniref:hypothetical protein n=1 Tax=Lysinibacter cavernae TaxID=1640652 RepID=UPI00361564B1
MGSENWTSIMHYLIPAGAEPLSSEGKTFPYLLQLADGQSIGANNLTDLVSATIDGYNELSDVITAESDDRFMARVDSLAALAGTRQALILASAQEMTPGISEELQEAGFTALLSDKDGLVLEFESWPFDIDLILLVTNYAPYNPKVAPPTGDRIIWINPHTERTYLESLAALGVGELHASVSDSDTEPLMD